MALSKAPATLEPEDLHLFRLRKISGYVSTNVLHLVFREETKRRRKHKALLEFYEDNGVPIAKFKKILNNKQIEKVSKDPEGNSFDVTLLYICIQWGSIKVANKNDDKWREGNSSLESLLTAIKNRRNEFSHEEHKYTNKQFIQKTQELRQLLTETLKLAGIRYRISQSIVDQWIKVINADINFLRDKSLIPLNLADYENQNLFLEQSQKVRYEGKLFLDKLYDGWDSISPASLILKLQFKVNLIFTKMILLSESKKGDEIEQKYEDLLANITHTISDPVILMESIAGVGKTTLTKKMLSDWVSGQNNMYMLPSYDLLLYAEFRNKSIKSFKELIRSLMPELARCFQDDDLTPVVLDQKVILIMDGMDELNPSSRDLFDDVLELKRTNDRLTIMVTTRPEKVETYYCLVNRLNIQTKHIKLIGIPTEKINEFVIKYEEEMKKESLSTHNISSLLDYLKKTADRLKDLWMLPYNLILLLILWRKNPSDVYNISTAPELYWKIHQMVRSKLINRLRLNDVTKHVLEHILNKKVDEFISSLGIEALVSLMNDDINLPEEAYKRLEDACVQKKIPPEEMTGAFLKTVVIRTPLGMDKKYSFPHKGSQEFAAALNIFEDILRQLEKHDVLKIEQDFKKFSFSRNLPQHLEQEFIRKLKEYYQSDTASSSTDTASTSASTASTSASTASTLASTASTSAATASTSVYSTIVPTPSTPPEPLSHDSTVIIDILKSLQGWSPMEIKKFQNVLIILLGMFYLHNDKIQERIKMEALRLLEESGINDRRDWIRILNSVKCDEFVGTFISGRRGILEPDGYEDVIEIEDFSLFAYITLLKALKSPLEYTGDMLFAIIIQGDLIGLTELLNLIKDHQFTVKKMLITSKNLTQYISVFKSLPSPILKRPKEVVIYIDMVEEASPKTKELMKQINQHQFSVEKVDLFHSYRNLDTKLIVEDDLNNIFQRCQLETYRGSLTPGLVLPFTLRKLSAGIADDKSYKVLQRFLQSDEQELVCLQVCISSNVDAQTLQPLLGSTIPDLYIADVQDAKRATLIAHKLLPTTGTKQFGYLCFPRYSSSVPVEEILNSIDMIVVGMGVVFPSIYRPTHTQQEDDLRQLAKNIEGSPPLYWGDDDIADIGKLDDW